MEKLKEEQGKGIVVTDAGAYPGQAKKIADLLGARYLDREIKYFPDSDPFWRSEDNIRGRWVIVHQPLGMTADGSTSDNFCRLIVALDAIGRASASRVDVLIPYFPGRQDRKSGPREPISARLWCDCLMLAGGKPLTRSTFMDLHSAQETGFLPPAFPADHLFAGLLLIDYYKGWFMERNISLADVCVVGGDLHMVKLVKQLAKKMSEDTAYAAIDKDRLSAHTTRSDDMIGSVERKHCLILDDEVSTYGTGESAVQFLMSRGAVSVQMACTHGKFADNPLDRFSAGAIERIETSSLTHLAVTDSLPWRFRSDPPKKIHIIDIAPFLAEVVYRIVNNLSISDLWEGIKV